MKCRYQFSIVARVRVGVGLPIFANGRTYRLIVDQKSRVLRGIEVTVQVDDPKLWPTILAGTAPGVKANLIPTLPFLDEIESDLRIIEGHLAPFGINAIETEFPTTYWKPETDSERQQLELNSFGIGRYRTPDDQLPLIEFNLIAQSILAIPYGADHQVALSFYRKGRNDLIERRHIEAIYNFYFMVETLFASGKFRKEEVLRELVQSAPLRAAIEEVLSKAEPLAGFQAQHATRNAFNNRYRKRSFEDICEVLYDLRGELHHHTPRRPGTWKPDQHKPFECDALFLSLVTQQLAFHLMQATTFRAEVAKAYEELRRKHSPKRADPKH